MAKNANPNEQFSMEQAMAFAGTPAGRQLIAIIQSKGSSDLQKAKSLAEAGNMKEAAKAMASLLADPEVQKLLKQYGG